MLQEGVGARPLDGAVSGVRSRVAPRPLAVWAAAMALLGWALMSLGAFVRASESGLGCPDWPACHGKLVSGGHHAMIEELHRWVAAVLILGTLGLAAAVLRSHRHEPRLTRPLAWALALLALQALLGGVTVILHNVSWTVVAHYGTAALFVASIALLAVRLALPAGAAQVPATGRRPPPSGSCDPAWEAPPGAPTRAPTGAPTGARDSLTRPVAWLAALSFGLLLAGSTVANTDSHTSCGRGFPLCRGSVLPSLDHHVVLNMAHRVWAAAVLALALWVLVRARRARAYEPALAWTAAAVVVLYLMQAGLGVAVVGLGENTALEVAHSSLGSLTWLAIATLLSLTRTADAHAGRFVGEQLLA